MTTPHRGRRLAVVAAVVGALFFGTASSSGATTHPPDPGLARFEGDFIDLTDGWGDARACTSDGSSTVCFRAELDMDAYLTTQPVRFACGTDLRLYSATGHGGSVLNLNAQGYWINLELYGFSNITSSYTIGSCPSAFADGTAGQTGYPGNTGAYASAISMVSGWDNRVSSIYIY